MKRKRNREREKLCDRRERASREKKVRGEKKRRACFQKFSSCLPGNGLLEGGERGSLKCQHACMREKECHALFIPPVLLHPPPPCLVLSHITGG